VKNSKKVVSVSREIGCGSFGGNPGAPAHLLSVKSGVRKCTRGEANRRARRVRSGEARDVYREKQETLKERKLAEVAQVAAVNNQTGWA
jgi:hypothetical protein